MMDGACRAAPLNCVSVLSQSAFSILALRKHTLQKARPSGTICHRYWESSRILGKHIVRPYALYVLAWCSMIVGPEDQ